MGFNITQNRDAVTGTFSLGDLHGTLSSGVVNEDGSLPIAGTIIDGKYTVQLANLRATSPAAGTMRGTFDSVFGASDMLGTGRTSAEIRDVTRTSGAVSSTARFGSGPQSFEDLIRLALKRL